MDILYPLVSVMIISLVSVIFAVPFLLRKKVSKKTLLFLLSVSVGVLLSTVFINFLPEAMEQGYGPGVALYIMGGFLFMFILEKFVHWHHSRACEDADSAHSHAYHLAPVNLIGDGVHNFIDGMIIAGSYASSTALGFAATLSIVFHEIPQEIADFGVLLYSGLSRKKALLFNLISASAAMMGALFGLVLFGRLQGFVNLVIPFAAGNFIYIAAANLTPQLHRHCRLADTFLHVLAIIMGMAIVALLTLYAPSHG